MAGHEKIHAAEHTNGDDDIQSATNAQKGLATAAQIQALEGLTASNTDANERGGFIGLNGVAVDNGDNPLDLSVVDGTRTLTLAPTSADFSFYDLDVKRTVTGSVNVVWTDVEGPHYFYFPSGSTTLTVTTTFDIGWIYGSTGTFVAELYWDATNKETILDGPVREMHQNQMSGATHYAMHTSIGAAMVDDGLVLNGFSVDGNGTLDAHAQFGNTAGKFRDEDQVFSVDAKASTVGYRILYLEGSEASPTLRQFTKAGFGVMTDVDAGIGATGRPVFNENNGGTWQLTTVSNNNYFLNHAFAIGVANGEDTYVKMGQTEHSTLGDAQDAAESELETVVSALVFAELRPLGSFICEARNSFTNAVKTVIRSTTDGGDYIDQRRARTGAGSASSSTVNDPDAVHVNVSGEIAAIAAKATPIAADYLISEDSADGNNKKSVTLGTLPVSTPQQTALDLKQDILAEGEFVDGDKTKLDGIEALADVTDATNVDAAGATMNTDTDLSSNSYFLDQDDMSSDDATKVASQQSIKAYAQPKTLEVNTQTGTSYTLAASDNGKIVTCNNASAITLTVPSGLGAGFNCTVIQLGAGQVTPTASGTTLNNRQSHTKTAGQYAAITLAAYVANTFAWQGDSA